MIEKKKKTPSELDNHKTRGKPNTVYNSIKQTM